MTQLTPAQTAQQNNRAGDGKYATKAVDESGVELGGPTPLEPFEVVLQRQVWVGDEPVDTHRETFDAAPVLARYDNDDRQYIIDTGDWDSVVEGAASLGIVEETDGPFYVETTGVSLGEWTARNSYKESDQPRLVAEALDRTEAKNKEAVVAAKQALADAQRDVARVAATRTIASLVDVPAGSHVQIDMYPIPDGYLVEMQGVVRPDGRIVGHCRGASFIVPEPAHRIPFFVEGGQDGGFAQDTLSVDSARGWLSTF